VPRADTARPELNGHAPETAALELRGVRAAYGKIEVLHDVDFAVRAGSVVAVLGPNGAGKSTMLKVIAGVMRPTAGRVLLEGHDVTGTSCEQLARVGVCLIPEGRGIFPNLTVRENVLMDTFSAGGRRTGDLEAVAYERFPALADRRDQLAGTLSGGEQQMLSLARALTTDPAIILLDELSMGLAPILVERLFDVVRQLAATGVTTLVVEQFASVVMSFADEVIVMTQGRVRTRGRPADIAGTLASAYLGGGLE
jgi:branched-chain amino acid transport system ATP-binding protein